ncbi:MAG TPA: hypothetical protein VN959_20990, partial [Mycobacterium sp.]|nr:hypothetical protein [Mycobacterium sp.]
VLDEQHPAYIGMYDGRLMDESVRKFVESCDCVVTVGTMMTDFNTGAFTARLDPQHTIEIGHHGTTVGSQIYPNVEIADILNELIRRVTLRTDKRPFEPTSLGPVVGSQDDAISVQALYPRWADFLERGVLPYRRPAGPGATPVSAGVTVE